MDDPRYPIGKFSWTTEPLDADTRRGLIARIATLPSELRAAVDGLTDPQLDTPYREGGWSARQVVHHVADSHMNAYVRFKWGATETTPRIKTYEQTLWAELVDARSAPVAPSLALLDGLHERWVWYLERLDATDFARAVDHPEWNTVPLDVFLQLYAWHGRHHTAHITGLRHRHAW